MCEKQATLTFITESLPGFVVGESTQFQIEASGGTTPYSFAITEGTPPNGLTLSNQGIISGTPTEIGNSTIFVKVTDDTGSNRTQAFDVNVSAPEEESTDQASRSTSAS